MRRLISLLTPAAQVPENLRQHVFITNVLSLLFSILTLILMGIIVALFGKGITAYLILVVALIFLLVIFLNRVNYNSGRLTFCLVPIWFSLIISMYGKVVNPEQSYIIFFDSRYIMLARKRGWKYSTNTS